MLGLTSHEAHFALLREEVRFGGKKSQRWTDLTFILYMMKLNLKYTGSLKRGGYWLHTKLTKY